MNIKLSIIISICNSEKYISQCIDSLLEQNLNEIEIICVVDPCGDNTVNILKNYQKEESRIRIIENDVNVGLAEARNIGFESAFGEYIYFIDSDDYLCPNTLAGIYELCKDNQLDGIIFNSHALIENEGFSVPVLQVKDLQKYNRKVLDGEEAFTLLFNNHSYVSSVWRYVWKKSFLLEEQLLFNKELRYAEDGPYTIKAILLAQKFMISDVFAHVYRRHADSLDTVYPVEKSICIFKAFYNIYNIWMTMELGNDAQRCLREFVTQRYKLAKQYYIYNKEQMSVKSFSDLKEQVAFQLMMDQNSLNSVTFDHDTIKKIRNSEKIVLYGAGNHAMDVIDTLNNCGIKISCIAITNPEKNKILEVNKIPVVGINSLLDQKDKILVIIGIKSVRAISEVKDLLEKNGFEYILA